MSASVQAGALALASAALLLSGCASLLDRAVDNFARDLETAVLNYDEPELAARALPAYMLILESRIEADPDRASNRLAAARLTAAYAELFAETVESEQRLAARALEHARHGACLMRELLCGISQRPLEELQRDIESLRGADIEPVHVLGTSWAIWIAAFDDDFEALAQAPRVEVLLDWVVAQAPEHDDGSAWLYLAVLNSQRPPAAGGRPALAREYYARALEISENRNLLIKVFMAGHYARLIHDRALYEELLEDVLAADPDQPGYVLTNHVARMRAREMLDDADRLFE